MYLQYPIFIQYFMTLETIAMRQEESNYWELDTNFDFFFLPFF